jgi:phage portal protein BeeE
MAFAGVAAAQNNTAPTPGDLQRQIAPEQPSALPQLQAKPPRIEKPTAQLEQALAPFTGVAMSMVQLNEASALVSGSLRSATLAGRAVFSSASLMARVL